MMMTRSLVHVHLPANPLIYEYYKAKLSLYIFEKRNKKKVKHKGFYNIIGEANNNNNNMGNNVCVASYNIVLAGYD